MSPTRAEEKLNKNNIKYNLYNFFLFSPSHRDNVPTMLVHSWSLDCQMFEGETVAGPIPTCLWEDPGASITAISNNSKRAFADYQRLVRAFFKPETIQPEEATNLGKKPR